MNTTPSFLTGIVCKSEHDAPTSTDYFWDNICGTYSITDNASRELNENIENKRKIASVLAQRKCRGIDALTKITSDRSGKEEDWILETIHNLVSDYPTSPLEMIDEALVNISHLIKHPSETITITKAEVWYLHSFNLESCFYILRQLEGLEYIRLISNEMSSKSFSIEAKG